MTFKPRPDMASFFNDKKKDEDESLKVNESVKEKKLKVIQQFLRASGEVLKRGAAYVISAPSTLYSYLINKSQSRYLKKWKNRKKIIGKGYGASSKAGIKKAKKAKRALEKKEKNHAKKVKSLQNKERNIKRYVRAKKVTFFAVVIPVSTLLLCSSFPSTKSKLINLFNHTVPPTVSKIQTTFLDFNLNQVIKNDNTLINPHIVKKAEVERLKKVKGTVTGSLTQNTSKIVFNCNPDSDKQAEYMDLTAGSQLVVLGKKSKGVHTYYDVVVAPLITAKMPKRDGKEVCSTTLPERLVKLNSATVKPNALTK